MSKNLKNEADSAFAFLNKSERAAPDGDALRDFRDAWTHGDLDCLQLDILTDMVKARLARRAAA
jgi:hypothetical protein